MSIRSNLKIDVSKWSNKPSIKQLTQQLTSYEQRLSALVKDFDLKGRDARIRSRQKLDQVLTQLKETRSKVEETVTSLVNAEGKKLNKKVNNLVSYLNGLARKEAMVANVSAGRAKKVGRPSRKTSAVRGKTKAKRRTTKTS